MQTRREFLKQAGMLLAGVGAAASGVLAIVPAESDDFNVAMGRGSPLILDNWSMPSEMFEGIREGSGRTFFVAPGDSIASDGNSGLSIDQPFETLGAAIACAQATAECPTDTILFFGAD